MSFGDDLKEKASAIFREQWKKRDGNVVPESEDVQLANEAVELGEATVLYADMADSTRLVDEHTWQFAAEVYKAFLYCAARVISSEDGTVTAYDGDRVMAVFLGDYKNSSAARAALKINYCNQYIITPALKEVYKDSTYVARHVTGIDTSPLRVARTGVRGANDLVWVGRAANYAAKLSSLPHEYATRITADVYKRLPDDLKTSEGKPMWEEVTWRDMGNITIYRSTYWWRVT